ncbi:MAG: MlaD family protein [Solirubrobacteraceae bacterium]
MNTQPHLTHDTRQLASERRYIRAAIISAVALVLLGLLAFVGIGALSSPYQIRGVFSSSGGLEPGNPVRIAGVNVGQVDGVTAGPRNTSIVSIQIDDSGRPIHADATLAILPRLLLEGNFYVAVDPGTPGTQALTSGGVIPQSHTSVPVQIDQVLDTFDLSTRDALQRTIRGLAQGLGAGALTARATPPPAGYAGLRAAVRSLNTALPSIATVASASQGTQPGDLDRVVRFSRDFAAELAQNPRALAAIVTDYDHVTAALASEDHALAESIQGLDLTLRAAPPSLTALDRALPTVTSFSEALDPALRAAPVPLRESAQVAAQLQQLVAPGKLPQLLAELQPVTTTLPQLEGRLRTLSPFVTEASQCLSSHVVWALDQTLPDGATSTGDPAWLDLLHFATSIISSSGGFDGNGSAERVGLASGTANISGIFPGIGKISGAGFSFQGVRPTWLGYGVQPPYRPDQWCAKQPLPNLSDRNGPPPSWNTVASPANQAAGG